MNKLYKYAMNHEWTFGKVLLFILTILLIVASTFSIYYFIKYGGERRQNQFSNSDLEYMISIIEKEYGNGQKFIILNKESKPIEKKESSYSCGYNGDERCDSTKYIGESAGIIGYFENDDKGYYFGFVRYISDSPYSQGNNVIIHTYTNDTYNIDDYMKGAKKWF